MPGEAKSTRDVIPPACHFFRRIIADPDLTVHDFKVVAEHTRHCAGCKDAVGQIIHERIEENRRAESSGTQGVGQTWPPLSHDDYY